MTIKIYLNSKDFIESERVYHGDNIDVHYVFDILQVFDANKMKTIDFIDPKDFYHIIIRMEK